MSVEQPEYFTPESQLPQIIGVLASAHDIEITGETFLNVVNIASACGIADDEIDRCPDPVVRKK